ncbi:MAG: response regulator [Acetobacteraceae bacterium]|nr:response regulator [Acetobacteraceae bacterium]
MSERALVLAPRGRDADVACRLLGEAGLIGRAVPDLAALDARLREGCGVLLLAEEALHGAELRPLAGWLRSQPPWSDLPILVLTSRSSGDQNPRAARLAAFLGNVSFLERPFHPTTLIGAVESALRGRRRQYEARARLEQIEAAQRELRAANDRLEAAVAARTSELREANAQLREEMAERARTEAALRQAQRLEAMGQLTGGVAHDFNNLLMVLSGGLAVLARSPDAAKRARAEDGMRQAVARGASLTRQLLAFARRRPVDPQVLDLAERLDAIRGMLGASLGGGIEVRVEAEPGLWPVEVDASELELALLNLAVNARDAMEGRGVVTLSARNLAGENQVAVTVTDTGPGIPAKVAQRAFEPFFTTKEDGKGSGLGLAQVHGFARSSGGSARIGTAPGGGAAIEIRLPRSRRRLAGPAPAAAPSGPPARALRLLLVEDSDAVAEPLTEMLGHLGHRVRRVASAPEALQALAEEPADLVLTDVMMPGGMDGVELASEIRRRHPAIAVVLASGRADAAQERARGVGAPLLGKPFDLDTLAGAIARATA